MSELDEIARLRERAEKLRKTADAASHALAKSLQSIADTVGRVAAVQMSIVSGYIYVLGANGTIYRIDRGLADAEDAWVASDTSRWQYLNAPIPGSAAEREWEAVVARYNERDGKSAQVFPIKRTHMTDGEISTFLAMSDTEAKARALAADVQAANEQLNAALGRAYAGGLIVDADVDLRQEPTVRLTVSLPLG